MIDAIKRLLGIKRRLVCYTFPVLVPGSGMSEPIDGFGHDYISARLDAMSRIDTCKYLVGPGVEKTVAGDTIH